MYTLMNAFIMKIKTFYAVQVILFPLLMSLIHTLSILIAGVCKIMKKMFFLKMCKSRCLFPFQWHIIYKVFEFCFPFQWRIKHKV